MHYSAAGKVQCSHLTHPSFYTPYPMSERIIDKGCPQQNENQEGAKLHPFRKSPGDQCGSDDREHHLIDHEVLSGNLISVVCVRFRTNPAQANPIEISDDSTNVGSKRQTVAPEDPLDADYADNDKAMHDSTENVFPSNQAAIEEKETWDRHHQHQSRRG